MSPSLQRGPMKWFVAAILALGVLRFVLTFAGFPDAVVKFSSMTVAILGGTLYFGVAAKTHWERLNAAYILIIPYMIIEVFVLGYTWTTGHQTIFHSHDYSLVFSIGQHTIGHLVGGLTWEPLTVFLLMEIVGRVARLIRK